MFFWKMIFSAMRRQVSKRLMIALTVFLGVSLTTSMLAVMMDIGDKIQAELSAFGANIEVVPQGDAIVADMYDIDSSEAQGTIAEEELANIKTIFWAHNIENFAPFLTGHTNVEGEETPLVGTWFNKTLTTVGGEKVTAGIAQMRNWWEVEGTWPTATTDVMVGARLANTRGWSVGQDITLTSDNDQVPATIVGIFQSGSDEDDKVFADLSIPQKLNDLSGAVDRVEVRAITTPDNDLARKAARDPSTLSLSEWETWYCTAYVSSIAYQIEEAMTNVDAGAVRQVADTEGTILEKTQLIMTAVAIFAMVAASLGIANLVTASVMERSKEIGLMKALGARNGSIVATIMTETLVVAGTGALLGFFAGIGLAQLVGHLVFNSWITIRPMVIPLMAITVILTVLLGCLPSMRYLLRLKPTQVLHGR